MAIKESRTVHIIAGPTASGKSALALEMAAAQNGVIINADSMQIYEGLPILTAQPSEEDKNRAPHRLYAALHPNDPCSAGLWRAMAIAEIQTALESGQTPIITGGTGFYLKALMEGLSPIPEIPPAIRAAAVALQKDMGNPGFHAALANRASVGVPACSGGRPRSAIISRNRRVAKSSAIRSPSCFIVMSCGIDQGAERGGAKSTSPSMTPCPPTLAHRRLPNGNIRLVSLHHGGDPRQSLSSALVTPP